MIIMDVMVVIIKPMPIISAELDDGSVASNSLRIHFLELLFAQETPNQQIYFFLSSSYLIWSSGNKSKKSLIYRFCLLISCFWYPLDIPRCWWWPCAQWLMRRRVSPAVTRGYLHIYIRTLIDFRPALNNNISIISQSHSSFTVILNSTFIRIVQTQQNEMFVSISNRKERRNKLDCQLSGPAKSIFR